MNIIRMVIEVLFVIAIPVVIVEQKHGSLGPDATPEEKEAHQKLKVEDYNFESDEMIKYSVENNVFPKWIAEVIKKLRGGIAPALVRLANFTGYFAHKGNPPSAGQ